MYAGELTMRCDAANPEEDAVIFCGNGSTSAVQKIVQVLGLQRTPHAADNAAAKAIVFLGPYEHHSNILPWRVRSTIATICCS